VPASVRALRGATTVDVDDRDHVHERVMELLRALFRANDVEHDDIISILFTATDDIHSTFPATAARASGYGDVPLICARELDVAESTPLCVRVLVHLTTERARSELHHVYLEGARGLRDDLPD
jgi:chorismate mutase